MSVFFFSALLYFFIWNVWIISRICRSWNIYSEFVKY